MPNTHITTTTTHTAIEATTPGGTASAEADRLTEVWHTERIATLRSPRFIGLVALVLLAVAAAAGASGGSRGGGLAIAAILLAAAVALARRSPQLAVLWSAPTRVRGLREQAAAERKIAARLEKLTDRGWVVAHDLQPGGWTGAQNVDHLLIGPPGAIIIGSAKALPAVRDDGEIDVAHKTLTRDGITTSALIVTVEHTKRQTDDQTGNPVVGLSGVLSWVEARPRQLDDDATIRRVAARARLLLSGSQRAPTSSNGGGVKPQPPAPRATTTTTTGSSRWADVLTTPERAAAQGLVPPSVDLDRLQTTLDKIDAMPGMEHVATQIRDFAKRALIEEERATHNLISSPMEVNAVFAGPPGTGKTTIAGFWGEVLVSLGRLSRGQVVETNRGGMVGEYIGQTAPKVRALFDEADGGVLFVDEAYALVPQDTDRDFGPEAVATMLELMENRRDTVCVIVAGYANEMDTFLDSNPGLRSRFAKTVTFNSYDAHTLVQIAGKLIAAKGDRLDDEGRELLTTRLTSVLRSPPKGWANARSARRIVDEAYAAQAVRLVDLDERTRDDLSTITAQDIQVALAAALA